MEVNIFFLQIFLLQTLPERIKALDRASHVLALELCQVTMAREFLISDYLRFEHSGPMALNIHRQKHFYLLICLEVRI